MSESDCLLDVNVLLALLWPDHLFHDRATSWFYEQGSRRWATCAFTQAAFTRLVSNGSFTSSPLSPIEAAALLAENLRSPSHKFWPIDIGYNEAVAPFSQRITGHRQVADAYLLGIAMNKKGKLATFDQAISSLLSKVAAATFITQV
jgi:uncharacterized protein